MSKQLKIHDNVFFPATSMAELKKKIKEDLQQIPGVHLGRPYMYA